MTWIKELQDIPHGESDEARLASGSSTQITTWQGYDINRYRFHTKEKDKKSASQNSDVQYEGIDESTGQTKTYFGQIEEIWELDYGGDLQLAVFQCQWVKPKVVVMDDYGLTTMELQSVSYKHDQWVPASYYAQVAYWPMPKDRKSMWFCPESRGLWELMESKAPKNTTTTLSSRSLPIIHRRSSWSRHMSTRPR
jgi:hypothetical protein